jgi:putative hydrolase
VRLLADLHTHSISSGHAYSTVTELARGAKRAGLELIAITDHGPACPGGAHPWHFWNLKVLPSAIGGVRLLKGVEANPAPEESSGLDLPDLILEVLDFVAVGFHPLAGFDERDVARNTDAMVRAIANPNVDMVTHPGNIAEFPVDVDAVVAAAVTHDVILELNDHSFEATGSRGRTSADEREFARRALVAGARVAIGSDAHYHMKVGGFERAVGVAEELGFTREDIVNRDAASVLEFLTSKRPRPRLDMGGEVEEAW